jgi:NAD(P)-dependent dehydrogenase (short-subunit alcohol dehydrogenase family)
MSGWLRGRVAIVTGASRGIGRATAEAIAAAGAHVILGARNLATLNDVAQAVNRLGGRATPVAVDVSRAEDVDALFAAAREKGPVTAVVCAAGMLHKAPFEALTQESWQHSLDVNLTGTFLCCHRAFGVMRNEGGGRIVTIASLSGLYGTEKFPGLLAYNVSKYGVVGLTEGLALEGRPFGIAAVCLSPGAVDTDMLRAANPLLRPLLGPGDVGAFIVSLLDGELPSVSGSNIAMFSNASS